MSKYHSLVQPLQCEWICSLTGLPCGQTFTSVADFTSHVQLFHLTTEPSSSPTSLTGGGTCHWNGCDFTTLTHTSTEFVSHVLFHPYHSYQKLLGAEYQAKHALPVCQLDPDLANVLPAIEVELKCLWQKSGMCGVMFESVGEFYRHVHDHVLCKDGCIGCCWNGCPFKARDRCKVMEHVRTHLKEKLIACPTCGAMFANNTKLKDHLNRQLPPTDPAHTCSYCHKCFPNERLLREHTRRHVNTLQCSECGLTCQSPSSLVRHIRFRHMAHFKPHECPLCHKSFKTPHTLADHIETHRDKTYQCTWPDCHYQGATLRNWNQHVKSVHGSSDKLYRCHICNEGFSLGRKLTTHLKQIHGFALPPGHCRFRYVAGLDGFKRLQTVRLDDDSLLTPDLDTMESTNTQSLNSSSTVCDNIAPSSSPQP